MVSDEQPKTHELIMLRDEAYVASGVRTALHKDDSARDRSQVPVHGSQPGSQRSAAHRDLGWLTKRGEQALGTWGQLKT
ncbi:hypothetical protein FHY34_002058 [Xanthomonas arboricola]|uniref:hypothetical protein n=1 Tax=Xanthomonas arboricola TaxID=56448 RepID=UPI0011B0D05E|nr:hypothetical protein [Xanthomonas arboricola]MBB4708197.1 hypothetical protein [Xanthomonas arboricola]NJC03010.1 hypothetical protein [Xanthomonas arboricola]